MRWRQLAASRALWRRPPRATRTPNALQRSFSVVAGRSDEGHTRMQRQVDPKHLDQTHRVPTAHLLDPQRNSAWQVIESKHLSYLDIPDGWDGDLEELQQRMAVRFNNVLHLKTALVHHGALPQKQIPAEVATQRLSNRCLEFLGDSLLGVAVSSFVFQSQPRFQEGQLTRLKAILVNNETLSKVAEHDLRIHDLILLGPDYSLSNPRDEKWYRKGRTTIQAGAVEALIAAVYVDQGLEAALRFVNDVVLPSAFRYVTEEHIFQPVVELQKMLQAHGYGHPVYRQVAAPSTSEEFQVELFVRDEYVLTGAGASYKEARVDAAHAGYLHFSPLLLQNSLH